MITEIIDKVKGCLRDDEVRLLYRMLFKFDDILRYFNKSNPRCVAGLEVEYLGSVLVDRRILSFKVRVSLRDGVRSPLTGDRGEGDVIMRFYYDLDAREGGFAGLYCDMCWLSPEDALDILDLARQLALVLYGGVVV
jgi:hypothetical protein